MSQQSGLLDKKANYVTGCIKQNRTRRLRGALLPISYHLVKLHLKHCVHLWATHLKKDRELLERVK